MTELTASERKLLAADMNNLKQKVKSEMARRRFSGTVAGYAAPSYDYNSPCTDNNFLQGEHLEKNLTPMRAVNPDGLTTYPNTLTKQDVEAMEVKIAAWATRNMEDRYATDCKSGCTGACFGGCASGCYNTCTGSCVNTCTSCVGGCQTTCTGTCVGACYNACQGCGGGCASSCDSCGGGCTGCWGCSGSCVGVSW